MSVDAAADRLPWLADEPAHRRGRHRGVGLLPPAIGAMGVVALGSWWAATSVHNGLVSSSRYSGASTTVPLPPPRPVARQVRAAPQTEFRSVAVPKPHLALRAATHKRTRKVLHAHLRKRGNPHLFSGPAASMVEIGAFGSIQQAKRGWSSTVRANPALARLPAKVTATRNSRGRTFYRMQVGMASVVHRELLCQRVKAIGLSCTAPDGSSKRKVER